MLDADRPAGYTANGVCPPKPITFRPPASPDPATANDLPIEKSVLEMLKRDGASRINKRTSYSAN